MRTTMTRFAGLALAAALALSGCSSVTETNAVTVNGRAISAEELESELLAIRGNDRYRESVEQGLSQQGLDLSITGEGTGTFDSSFVARLLSLSVYYQLLEQEIAEREVEVTASDLDEIRPQVVNAVGGDVVFDAFPAAYQESLVRRQAMSLKLQSVIGAEFAPERAREVYEENPDDFTGVCVSHIFANVQQRGPEAALARIEDLARQLEEGADFEVLATEQSDDAAAAAQGGSLDCGGPGRFLEEFERAAFEIPVGEVSDPVETEAGFHLILVSERRPLEFEEVQGQIEQELQRRQLAAFSTFIDDLTCEAEVDVNPRYGSWEGGCDDPEAIGEVLPPEGPESPVTTPGFPGGPEFEGDPPPGQ
jgi:parvulin-like peptidyl-prolyl isomerase